MSMSRSRDKLDQSLEKIQSKDKVGKDGRKSQSSIGKEWDPQTRIKMRRKSFGFSQIRGVKAVERTSQMVIPADFKRPHTSFLPTYQLNPLKPFHVIDVTEMVESVVEERFAAHVYDPETTPAAAMLLAFQIMKLIKLQNYNRYRVISVVTIGQNRSQSYNNTVSFLWDTERDRYVDVHKTLSTCFIQVTVFGVYLD